MSHIKDIERWPTQKKWEDIFSCRMYCERQISSEITSTCRCIHNNNNSDEEQAAKAEPRSVYTAQ